MVPQFLIWYVSDLGPSIRPWTEDTSLALATHAVINSIALERFDATVYDDIALSLSRARPITTRSIIIN